jgi:hypothetical protein
MIRWGWADVANEQAYVTLRAHAPQPSNALATAGACSASGRQLAAKTRPSKAIHVGAYASSGEQRIAVAPIARKTRSLRPGSGLNEVGAVGRAVNVTAAS